MGPDATEDNKEMSNTVDNCPKTRVGSVNEEAAKLPNDKQDWQTKYRTLCRKLEDMTPGGSEFVNDPDYCLAYLRNKMRQDFAMIKSYVRRSNSGWLLRRLWLLAARREGRRIP